MNINEYHFNSRALVTQIIGLPPLEVDAAKLMERRRGARGQLRTWLNGHSCEICFLAVEGEGESANVSLVPFQLIELSPLTEAGMHALDAARDLVEKGWCQGAHALQADGKRTSATDTEACKWCLNAAITRAVHDGYSNQGEAVVERVLDEVQQRLFFVMGVSANSNFFTLVEWNDKQGRTLEEVTALLTEAARL